MLPPSPGLCPAFMFLPHSGEGTLLLCLYLSPKLSSVPSWFPGLKLPASCSWCAWGSPSAPSRPIQGFLMELLREVQPTTFCGIPWVWDHMLDSLKTKHLDSTAFRRRIDRWAMRMGLSTNKRRMMGYSRLWTGAQGAEPGGGGGWDLGAAVTRSASSTALLLKGDPPAAVLRPGQEIDLQACQEVPGSQPLRAVSKCGHGAAD